MDTTTITIAITSTNLSLIYIYIYLTTSNVNSCHPARHPRPRKTRLPRIYGTFERFHSIIPPFPRNCATDRLNPRDTGWLGMGRKIRGGWGRSTILYVVRFRLDSVRLNARLDRYSSRWVKFHRSFFWVDKLMDRPLMNFIWKLGRNFSISWRVRSWIYFLCFISECATFFNIFYKGRVKISQSIFHPIQNPII